MGHGGWEDWETFREHYLGEFSPAALARGRRKVEWLTGDTLQTDDISSEHLAFCDRYVNHRDTGMGSTIRLERTTDL